MTEPTRYFAPICLYPHTRYRTIAGVTRLFTQYDLMQNDYLIVVADRLLALDNLVTGRYWSVNTVFDKARREATQIYNLVNRVSTKCGARLRGRRVFWDEIAETPSFKEFSNRLRTAFLSERVLADALEEFVKRRVNRFGLGSSPEQEQSYEREYLLSEVCMSVFCTEILGYQMEIWERRPPPEIPDPLKLLYGDYRGIVESVAGGTPKRQLTFLYEADAADMKNIKPS
jgi:hypothetical protein